MAFEHYIYTGTTRLRCGYTTGSCAALAAKAACEMLLSRKPVGLVSIVTPGGLPVEANVVDAYIGEGCAQCAVRKDAGDDADVTDGVLVYARVEHARSGTGAAGSKGVPTRESEVSVDGGVGVGRVTLPGLEQPVGAAAINATPRAMITSAVREVCAAHGFSGNIAVTISVPEGVSLAEKTFNPHLGIEGGISILGTTGIVEPRSLAALRDSIELEIRQHAAMGRRGVVLTPGNYGGQFISGHFHLNGAPVVFISNFVGDAIDCCVREGFTNVLLVGHIGKLVKVAGGIMDTHSRTADCRAEILAAHAALAGAGAKTVREIMSSVTTTAALEVIEAAGVGDDARASLAAAIEDRLRRRAAGACDIAAVVFDAERRELFRTSGADAVIGELGATYE
ncbi:MAG: cobalamin biosynthesis protein CbiD [Collinsella sp. 60_9]|nr:MAG: cobalamin biosynthesis protein CbiD [Collinsella sp. 60_9]